MPVRSLSSRVLVWPNRRTVELALREWAHLNGRLHPDLLRVGFFGSYARGTWGVGSDLDLLLLVARSDEPWERRASSWDTLPLPVPVDTIVYTIDEWEGLCGRAGTLPATVSPEVEWVFTREDPLPSPDRNA